MKNFAARLFAVSLIIVCLVNFSQAAPPGYHVVKKITLGGEGGWDYLTVDSDAQRLYLSRSTKVVVVDLKTGQVAGEIPDTPGVHGIALAPKLGKGFISNGRDNSVTIFELKTLKTLDKLKVGQNPDTIIYDEASGRVFTMNGTSKDTTAIDAASGKAVGTLALDGRPEFAVSDGKGRIFVNLEDKNEIVAFDAGQLKVLSRWPLKPGEEPTGLAFDKAHKRLFAVCGNKNMVVMDSDNGKVISSLPIGAGADAAAYDASAKLVFSSNGDGTLTVVQAGKGDKYSVLETVATQRGARTMALDEKTHLIYLVSADFGPPPAPTPERPRPRPGIVPGTFAILVVGR